MLSWKSDVFGSCTEMRSKSKIAGFGGFGGYVFFQRRHLCAGPLLLNTCDRSILSTWKSVYLAYFNKTGQDTRCDPIWGRIRG